MTAFFSFCRSFLSFFFAGRQARATLVTARVSSVWEIDFAMYAARGVRAVIFDLDDVLAPPGEMITPDMCTFLQELIQKYSLRIGILTNTSRRRKEELARLFLDTEIVVLEEHVRKPHTDGYLQMMRRLYSSPDTTMMVGDRVGTDVWGAYQGGIHTRILVEPYSYRFGGRKAFVGIRWFRWFEKILGAHFVSGK